MIFVHHPLGLSFLDIFPFQFVSNKYIKLLHLLLVWTNSNRLFNSTTSIITSTAIQLQLIHISRFRTSKFLIKKISVICQIIKIVYYKKYKIKLYILYFHINEF